MPVLSEGTFPLSSRSPRVRKKLPVTLWETSCEKGKKWSGTTLDLSDHGLRVATGTNLRQGQEVCVILNNTGLRFKRCRVVWTRPWRIPQMNQAGLEVLK